MQNKKQTSSRLFNTNNYPHLNMNVYLAVNGVGKKCDSSSFSNKSSTLMANSNINYTKINQTCNSYTSTIGSRKPSATLASSISNVYNPNHAQTTQNSQNINSLNNSTNICRKDRNSNNPPFSITFTNPELSASILQNNYIKTASSSDLNGHTQQCSNRNPNISLINPNSYPSVSNPPRQRQSTTKQFRLMASHLNSCLQNYYNKNHKDVLSELEDLYRIPLTKQQRILMEEIVSGRYLEVMLDKNVSKLARDMLLRNNAVSKNINEYYCTYQKYINNMTGNNQRNRQAQTNQALTFDTIQLINSNKNLQINDDACNEYHYRSVGQTDANLQDQRAYKNDLSTGNKLNITNQDGNAINTNQYDFTIKISKYQSYEQNNQKSFSRNQNNINFNRRQRPLSSAQKRQPNQNRCKNTGANICNRVNTNIGVTDNSPIFKNRKYIKNSSNLYYANMAQHHHLGNMIQNDEKNHHHDGHEFHQNQYNQVYICENYHKLRVDNYNTNGANTNNDLKKIHQTLQDVHFQISNQQSKRLKKAFQEDPLNNNTETHYIQHQRQLQTKNNRIDLLNRNYSTNIRINSQKYNQINYNKRRHSISKSDYNGGPSLNLNTNKNSRILQKKLNVQTYNLFNQTQLQSQTYQIYWNDRPCKFGNVQQQDKQKLQYKILSMNGTLATNVVKPQGYKAKSKCWGTSVAANGKISGNALMKQKIANVRESSKNSQQSNLFFSMIRYKS